MYRLLYSISYVHDKALRVELLAFDTSVNEEMFVTKQIK
jgi:hypothetical protein